ncbi:MAG: hypothetical protein BJG00_000180 [Limnothrix sp. CACIAM 69d]|nr:MAG: hypothetical protein BJG00_000180 [Limnothrix sp. CACIAM 69d]
MVAIYLQMVMNPIVLASKLGKIYAIALHMSGIPARTDPGLRIPACGSGQTKIDLDSRPGFETPCPDLAPLIPIGRWQGGDTFPAAITQHPTRDKLGID